MDASDSGANRAQKQPSDADRLLEVITDAWEQVLGHHDFGPDDWFFDVGGDSLQYPFAILLWQWSALVCT